MVVSRIVRLTVNHRQVEPIEMGGSFPCGVTMGGFIFTQRPERKSASRAAWSRITCVLQKLLQ